MGGGSSKKFGRGTTSTKVAIDARDNENVDLTGKVYIVTGGNRGSGFETVRCLSLLGATTIIASRNEERGSEAVKKINDEFPSKSDTPLCRFLRLDFADAATIKRFSEEFLVLDLPLHGLVNNAGLMPRKKTFSKQGFEMTFAVNYFGAFYLTHLLLDKLKATPSSRVVNLSSLVNRMQSSKNFDESISKDYPKREGSDFEFKPGPFGTPIEYINTKLFLVMHAKTLHRKFKDDDIAFFAIHPGTFINPNYEEGTFSTFYARYFGDTIETGSATTVYTALHPEAKQFSGEYLMGCNVATCASQANDESKQDELWELSMKLVAEVEEGIAQRN